jgi:hypothetical protein
MSPERALNPDTTFDVLLLHESIYRSVIENKDDEAPKQPSAKVPLNPWATPSRRQQKSQMRVVQVLAIALL